MTGDREGLRVSANTVRWINVAALVIGAAGVICGGASWLLTVNMNSTTRDAAETRHRSVETEFATVVARIDAHQQLIERNAADIEGLRKDLTQKYDRIEEQLQKILEALGRLNGRVGEGKGRESSKALAANGGIGP